MRDKRIEEGLRILARIIAREHLRSLNAATGSDSGHEVGPGDTANDAAEESGGVLEQTAGIEGRRKEISKDA